MKPMPACFEKLVLSLAERSVYSVIICAFLISSAFAQSDATFVNANQEYAQSHFQEAIDALALDQHHPEADANLRIVRDEARALELTAPLVERYLKFANVNQFTIAAAIALWVAAFCIVALIFARRRSGIVIALSIVALSIFAGAVSAIYELDTGSHGRALAIVTGMNVQARVATADNANSVLALPPGSEIRVLSNRGDWIYAALPNSLRGWVPAKSAEAVQL
jgi:hypothetical protein